ncbi:hypothetical protein X975_16431, partial [Stegodyphus mimosarum]
MKCIFYLFIFFVTEIFGYLLCICQTFLGSCAFTVCNFQFSTLPIMTTISLSANLLAFSYLLV